MPKTKSKRKADYGQIKIPKDLIREIDKALGKHGYVSRQEFTKDAIRRLLHTYEIGVTREEKKSNNNLMDDEFLLSVKRTLFLHTTINMANGKPLPSNHVSSKQLEQQIKEYVIKQAKAKGIIVTEKYVDSVTKEIIKFHKQTLEDLAMLDTC